MTREGLLLLIVLAAPLLLFWQRSLNEPDEGRYVEIAREMLVSGDWITPRVKGVPHYAKPPFSYWALAASMAVFGANEFAVRLPGALAALLVILLVRDLASRLAGTAAAGLRAALALGGMIQFAALARIVTTDMLHTLLVVTAIRAFLIADLEEARRRRHSLIGFAALGLGFLNKGPVPLAVVLSGLAAAALVRRDLRPFRGRGWLAGLALLLAIGLPWYLLVAARDPELYRFFLGGEVVDRVASGRGRSKPFFYFLLVLPLGLLPMTPLVLRGLVRLVRDRTAVHRAELLGFLLGPFLLFSLSASKLWTYVLPLLPVAALVAALTTSGRSLRLLAALHALGTLLVLGLDLAAERRALDLGNNVGYRAVHRAFAAEGFRGVPIPSEILPATAPPRYRAGPETRIATFRLRFTAAGFYFLGERAEYLPIYGGDSLWEWPGRAAAERVPDLDDLARELRRDEPMLVLAKRRDLEELRAAAGVPLAIERVFGRGPEAVVACRRCR